MVVQFPFYDDSFTMTVQFSRVGFSCIGTLTLLRECLKNLKKSFLVQIQQIVQEKILQNAVPRFHKLEHIC
jgi:hypothetical protein